ncbi:MAG: hypothetical protein ACI92N_000361 [Pseudomonadales bacterium]|jgi:hypothetical protein
MIIKTILNFSGLYAALQFCAIITGHVFNLEIPPGAQIGLIMAAAYGAMMTSVSALGRAPSRSENWILSVVINFCALIISLMFTAAMLYFTGGIYAFQEFIGVFSDIPVAALFVGFGGGMNAFVKFTRDALGNLSPEYAQAYSDSLNQFPPSIT